MPYKEKNIQTKFKFVISASNLNFLCHLFNALLNGHAQVDLVSLALTLYSGMFFFRLHAQLSASLSPYFYYV